MIQQELLLKRLTLKQISLLSPEDKDRFIEAQSRVIEDISRENTLLKNREESLKQKTLNLDEEFITIKYTVVPSKGSSDDSRQQANTSNRESRRKNPRRKKKKIQLPSERYPNAEVVEEEVSYKDAPQCNSCGSEMTSSGMFEVSEYLTVQPAVFRVIRQKREKFTCSCQACIKTAPAPPRIVPGGAYSDDMIIDIAMSKYCDLIPIDRYRAIASREGLIDLPPQSLIQQTHYLADFVRTVYKLLRKEVLLARVLHSDETPHRMLERGGKTKNGKPKRWYLWGFSDGKANAFFEVRDTRSGDVASDVLKESVCEFLVSDVFSGYGKSVRVTNEFRKELGQKLEIKNIYCNAHSFRKYRDLENEEFTDILKLWDKIYRLDGIASRRPTPERALLARARMKPLYEEIKTLGLSKVMEYSRKSDEFKAINYFITNYNELTLFIGDAEIPIDNNPQERLFRNPVIGRKTWYGNHSPQGAETSAILFSIVESCKLVGVNPREYFKKLVEDLHQGKSPYTPATCAKNTR